jgi:hypothetical protein
MRCVVGWLVVCHVSKQKLDLIPVEATPRRHRGVVDDLCFCDAVGAARDRKVCRRGEERVAKQLFLSELGVWGSGRHEDDYMWSPSTWCQHNKLFGDFTRWVGALLLTRFFCRCFSIRQSFFTLAPTRFKKVGVGSFIPSTIATDRRFRLLPFRVCLTFLFGSFQECQLILASSQNES